MLKVLYVEDDPASRDVLRMIQRLNPGLLDVVILEDSHEFERQLRTITPRPELLLLDIHVRPLNGFEMLRITRHTPGLDRVPIVALTASVMNEEIDLLRNAGFDGVLSKPVDMDQFPDALARIMRGENLWMVW